MHNKQDFIGIKNIEHLLKSAGSWFDYGPLSYVFNHDQADILDDIQEYFNLNDGMAKDVWTQVQPQADAGAAQIKPAPEEQYPETDASGDYGDIITNFSEYYDISLGKARALVDKIMPQIQQAVEKITSERGIIDSTMGAITGF